MDEHSSNFQPGYWTSENKKLTLVDGASLEKERLINSLHMIKDYRVSEEYKKPPLPIVGKSSI